MQFYGYKSSITLANILVVFKALQPLKTTSMGRTTRSNKLWILVRIYRYNI